MMVVVGALGLFVLTFLSLIGSFECFDGVILSLTGSFEHSFVQEILIESFDVINLFDDVTL